jgi:hypothetical protein
MNCSIPENSLNQVLLLLLGLLLLTTLMEMTMDRGHLRGRELVAMILRLDHSLLLQLLGWVLLLVLRGRSLTITLTEGRSHSQKKVRTKLLEIVPPFLLVLGKQEFKLVCLCPKVRWLLIRLLVR